MQKYFETNPRDFMAVATPGAGKTTFALTLAKELFNRGTSASSSLWRRPTT